MARFEVLFWETEDGDKPVADWLKTLSLEDRVYLGDIFYDLAMDGPSSRPKVFKHLEGPLWEIRDLRKGAGYRVYFGFDGEIICIVVNAGSKRTQSQDTKLAKKRVGDLLWKK